MDSGQCSYSNNQSGGVWAKLVPSGTDHPVVELHSTNVIVRSQVKSSSTEMQEWCEIGPSSEQDVVARIRNLSSTEIIVNGNPVAVGAEAIGLKDGAEIISGPNRESYLSYTLQMILSPNPDTKSIKIELDVVDAICSICLNVWHDVVTVAPCLHNFCNGCISEWLRKASSGSCHNAQNVPCPQCRAIVHSVGKNHFLQNIEEAIFQSFSSLKRSDEEIALLNSYSSVKTTLLLGWKKSPRKGPTRPPGNRHEILLPSSPIVETDPTTWLRRAAPEAPPEPVPQLMPHQFEPQPPPAPPPHLAHPGAEQAWQQSIIDYMVSMNNHWQQQLTAMNLHCNARFDQLRSSMDELNSRIDHLDQRFDRVDTRLNDIMYRWTDDQFQDLHEVGPLTRQMAQMHVRNQALTNNYIVVPTGLRRAQLRSLAFEDLSDDDDAAS